MINFCECTHHNALTCLSRLHGMSRFNALLMIERGTTHWLARILEPGKEPYYFVPSQQDWISTKGDLIRAVNKAHPGVTYLSAELFNQKVEDTQS